jgi:hypothetical protein
LNENKLTLDAEFMHGMAGVIIFINSSGLAFAGHDTL